MLATLAITLSLLNSPGPWQFARAIVWGVMHDHPAIEFDRCKRKRNRTICKRERIDNERDACRFILKGRCPL